MWGRYYGKLRAARTRSGLTQTELAKKAGTTPGYISRLESDPFIQIRPRLLKSLAAALGTTVEEVWDSPYEALDEETHTGLAKRERNILREFLKLDRKSRLRIVEVQKRLNEHEEQEYADAGRSTKKRQPDP